MKHFKRILILLLSAVFSVVLVLSACDGTGNGDSNGKQDPDDGKQDPDDGLKVTVGDYDTTRGTVSVSAPANGSSYELSESVTVTAEGKEGYESAAILVNGAVKERIAGSYTFLLTQSVTVSAVFRDSTASLPEVTFASPAVSAFDAVFLGHWSSGAGELFIGEKKLSYKGTAISSVTPRNSGNEQSYNFELGGVAYSLAWARSDYTVGYVIDVLNLSDDTREYFLPDPLPLAEAKIAEKYAGDWTAEENGETYTLSVKDGALAFNGDAISAFVDGGYYETTKDMFATPIGTNIYFFLHGGTMRILMWNGTLECPTVDDFIFDGGGEEKTYTFPEELRGTWKSADGTTAVITGSSFTLGGAAISAKEGSDAAFLFTLDGKEYEASLLAGSKYILQLTAYDYGADGLISGVTYEYYLREDRPAVVPDGILEGTWTGTWEKKPSAVAVTGGVITWDGKEVSVIEAGEEREDGFVYFILVGGKVYELFVLNTAESGESPVWSMTLSGADGTADFAKS